MDNQQTTQDAIVAIHAETSHATLVKLQKFTALLNREPDAANIEPTADGKARTLQIGRAHV